MIGIAPNPGGFDLLDGSWLAALSQGQNNSYQSIAAHAGASRDAATQIQPSSDLIAIVTVANAGDSVRLPAAKAGMVKMVLNATANSANIYGYRASDTFNGVANNPISLAGGSSFIFSCPRDGIWAAISGGGGGGYVAKAVHFDGVSSLNAASLVIPQSHYFLCSGWIFGLTDIGGAGSGTQLVYNNGLGWFNLGTKRNLGGGFASTAQMFDGSSQQIGSFASGPITDYSIWNHVATSIDTLAQVIQVYVNRVPVDPGITLPWLSNNPLGPANDGPWCLPGLDFGNPIDLADVLWATPTSFYDLSDAANLDRLITPEGKPANPDGFPPAIVICSGDATGFIINQGTGGPFTIAGNTPTNATTSPSD